MIRPVKYPLEFYSDEVRGKRLVCRCTNKQECQMAARGVAWTYLDVKFPQQVCRGCGNEFEYLAEDCTHPYVSFAPPYTEQSSKGKGKGKGKSKSNNDKGYNGKGMGKDAGYKSKGHGKGNDVGRDVMNFLQQFGANLFTEEQANQINDAMQSYNKKLTSLPAKSDLQTAKIEYKAAIADMNVARSHMNQAKESVQAIDKKFKAAMILVCEHTQNYTHLKEQAEVYKDKLDTLQKVQEDTIDASIHDISTAHANAMIQLDAFNTDAAEEATSVNDEDGDNVYGKAAPQSEPIDLEDTEMMQAAVKRPPPLNLSQDQPLEEIMSTLHCLNTAKKAKSTPRGSEGEGPE